MKAILQNNFSASSDILRLAFELSKKTWKLGFSNGERFSSNSIDAGDWQTLMEKIAQAKKKFHLAADCQVISCYEAGRDGFWIHRALEAAGIENHVLDSASIEVNRRKRRAKTDGLDVKSLINILNRHLSGERGALHSIRIPLVEDEDLRRLGRERKRLVKERGAHSTRIKSLLFLHGIQLKKISDLPVLLPTARAAVVGYALPADLKRELEREYARYCLVDEQLKAVERTQQERLAAGETAAVRAVAALMRLKSLGPQSSWLLQMEFFNWRVFKNSKQIGGCSGFAPTPYDSGDSRREQGIGKNGSAWIRPMMIELGWQWLRHQPGSALSLWYEKRFAHGGKRMRKIGITALARKLLIALWRYLDQGVVPEGAVFKC
jgi:transposase